jgi:FecR protein
MKNDDKRDALERNLAEMLSMGRDQVTPDSEERLVQVVGREVQRQRRAQIQKRWFVRTAAAAAILIVAILIVQQSRVGSDEPIGTITDVQGLVVVSNGAGPAVVQGPRSVHAQQWVQTQSGTTAQVLLTDQSQLTPRPRTVMQLDKQKHGHVVRLERGSVAIAAHKQPPKQYLMVETPGTAIKILGTKLDVRVVERPTGAKQTRIYLHSGSVELASGGISTLLLPGMVGITEEGKAPSGESSVLEVNELRRLLRDTRQRAERTNARANMPMIIDYVSSTVWTIVPLSQFDAEPANIYSLRLKYPAFCVKAYTLEGAATDTQAEGRVLHVDLSQRPKAAGVVTDVILRIPNATGLFRIDDMAYELAMPAASSDCVTLLQLCLPKSAAVQAVQGQVIETSERLGRLVVTLMADSQTLQIYE